MAEAVAAFSVAANVIQFIDFGTRLTSQFWKFYRSIRESREAVPDIKTINKDLREVSKRLEASKTEDEEANKGLKVLAAECYSVAVGLDKLLASLLACSINPSRI